MTSLCENKVKGRRIGMITPHFAIEGYAEMIPYFSDKFQLKMIRPGWQLQAKQGRRKQSVDGQAQLDANSSRAKRAAKTEKWLS